MLPPLYPRPEGIATLALTGPNCGLRLPAQHVEDAAAASEFYGNKARRETESTETACKKIFFTLTSPASQLFDRHGSPHHPQLALLRC